MQVWRTDDALARVLPQWQVAGYDVFVTADHGINADGHHGGDEAVMRDVPFYYLGPRDCTLDAEDVLDQKSVAPTILSVVGIELAETMTRPSLLNE